jgi:hypothetical protein
VLHRPRTPALFDFNTPSARVISGSIPFSISAFLFNRAVNILDVGRVHLHGKQQAIRIGNDVAFSSLHLLTRNAPSRFAPFSGCTADEICSQHFLLYMTVIFGLGEKTAR